jgi:hypothetical protein
MLCYSAVSFTSLGNRAAVRVETMPSLLRRFTTVLVVCRLQAQDVCAAVNSTSHAEEARIMRLQSAADFSDTGLHGVPCILVTLLLCRTLDMSVAHCADVSPVTIVND